LPPNVVRPVVSSLEFKVTDTTAQQAYDYLVQFYPASTLDWVKDATWTYDTAVPLDDINMSRRPGGRDPKKVAGIMQAIQSGQKMDPVVLVQPPGESDYDVADGYHRTMAYKKLGQATTTAYIGKVTQDDGPWLKEMHDKKLNLATLRMLEFAFSENEERDSAGRWTSGASLTVKDYAGTPGDRSHITRIEKGTLPIGDVANLKGVSGEVPGEHRNRQGPAWDSFVNDVKTNGIKEPIFITHDPGEEPKISEGNHRRDAAVEAGLKDVPVEIRHFGHAEQEPVTQVSLSVEDEARDVHGRWTSGAERDSTVNDAITSWKGSPLVLLPYLDEKKPTDYPDQVEHKKQVQALVKEVRENGRTNDVPLYRGERPGTRSAPLESWSEDRGVAERFTHGPYGTTPGAVTTLAPGEAHGIRVADYLGEPADAIEHEWILAGDRHAKPEPVTASLEFNVADEERDSQGRWEADASSVFRGVHGSSDDPVQRATEAKEAAAYTRSGGLGSGIHGRGIYASDMHEIAQGFAHSNSSDTTGVVMHGKLDPNANIAHDQDIPKGESRPADWAANHGFDGYDSGSHLVITNQDKVAWDPHDYSLEQSHVFSQYPSVKATGEAALSNVPIVPGPSFTASGALSKTAVRYEHPAAIPSHNCGLCIHFQEPKGCALVSGVIQPEDWCELWAPEVVTAAGDELRDDHGRWTSGGGDASLPDGYKVTKEHSVVTVAGKSFLSDYYVVRGPVDPNREDKEDFTKPVVSEKYMSRSAIDSAIKNGTWKSITAGTRADFKILSDTVVPAPMWYRRGFLPEEKQPNTLQPEVPLHDLKKEEDRLEEKSIPITALSTLDFAFTEDEARDYRGRWTSGDSAAAAEALSNGKKPENAGIGKDLRAAGPMLTDIYARHGMADHMSALHNTLGLVRTNDRAEFEKRVADAKNPNPSGRAKEGYYINASPGDVGIRGAAALVHAYENAPDTDKPLYRGIKLETPPQVGDTMKLGLDAFSSKEATARDFVDKYGLAKGDGYLMKTDGPTKALSIQPIAGDMKLSEWRVAGLMKVTGVEGNVVTVKQIDSDPWAKPKPDSTVAAATVIEFEERDSHGRWTADGADDVHTYYHDAPSNARVAVTNSGLRGQGKYKGRVYVSRDPYPTSRTGHGDIWKVNTAGLKLHQDPEGDENDYYVKGDVGPERVALHQPSDVDDNAEVNRVWPANMASNALEFGGDDWDELDDDLKKQQKGGDATDKEPGSPAVLEDIGKDEDLEDKLGKKDDPKPGGVTADASFYSTSVDDDTVVSMDKKDVSKDNDKKASRDRHPSTGKSPNPNAKRFVTPFSALKRIK
jgi:hypothetical protein